MSELRAGPRLCIHDAHGPSDRLDVDANWWSLAHTGQEGQEGIRLQFRRMSRALTVSACACQPPLGKTQENYAKIWIIFSKAIQNFTKQEKYKCQIQFFKT